jgi:hypothetical protein
MSLDTSFGLPTHILVIHAVIVLVPLAAVGVILYAAIPAWRSVLRWPTFVVATLGAGAAPVAYLSGQQLRDRIGAGQLESVQRHADLGLTSLVVIGVWWLACLALLGFSRRFKDAPVLLVVAVLLSVGVIVSVVMTGHSGSEAVWGPIVESTTGG